MTNLASERRRASGSAQWPSFEQVPERMRRMLEQTLGSFSPPALLSEASSWTPPVDIEEEDEAYVLEAEKIDARLADGVLTVRVPKAERAPRQRIEVKGS